MRTQHAFSTIDHRSFPAREEPARRQINKRLALMFFAVRLSGLKLPEH
jgi:hypothetical protein